jgi:pimeloyl-ACP methyl ester carboxylesterase
MDGKRIEVKSSETTKAYLWTVGDEQNLPLLLVPGFTGTHTDLMKTAAVLSKKYFVYVPDMPGWGESPRFAKELTIKNYATYVKSILEQLGIEKVTYVGHCMGATIGIEFAARFPEKLQQMFLISSPNLGNTIYHKLLNFVADSAVKFPKPIRPLFYLWRNRFFGTVANIFVVRLKGKLRKLRLIFHYVLIQGDPKEDSVEEAWKSMIHFDYAKIKDIKIPVHLIHGEEDILITKKRVNELQKFLPSVTVDYVSDCGHSPPVENPIGTAEAILRY